MSAKLESGSAAQLPPGVAAALAAAEIPQSKLGPARCARLSAAEQELYFWILRRFADSGRPSGEDLCTETQRLGLDAAAAFTTLARDDLVHLDADGEITVAYPFSGSPTAHKVRLERGHDVYAMCALDALGIAPMFGAPVAIASRDPLTGDEIHVELAADGRADWRPQSAVVVAGALDRQGNACGGCCPVLNFFHSAESAGSWLEAHAEVRGHVISLPEAIAAARAVFGDVFG